MIQATSIEAYLIIKREGLLNKMQQEVYECIHNNQPILASEVFTLLGIKTNQSGRITELKELGVVISEGRRKDPTTGMSGMLLKTTNRTPETPWKPTKKQGKAEINRITAEIRTNIFISSDHKEMLHEIDRIIKSL